MRGMKISGPEIYRLMLERLSVEQHTDHLTRLKRLRRKVVDVCNLNGTTYPMRRKDAVAFVEKALLERTS